VKPLAGRRILVTRPRELAAGLAALIARRRRRAVLYPAIEILDPRRPQPRARAARARWRVRSRGVREPERGAQGARAARRAVARAHRRRGRRHAARALEERGMRDVIAPEGRADSEALLELPALQRMQGLRVLIVRGEGGRELLARELAARGARVEIAECYRRAPPSAPPPPGALDAACVGSAEALDNLVAAFGRERLRALPVFVPHARVEQHARELGLEAPVLAGPRDAQMLACLVAYFGGAK
jgi:uroporphyrinogen-III synthase